VGVDIGVPLTLPSPARDCVVIGIRGERQSDSKDLECGSFTLWEIVVCIKQNVFIGLARLNPKA
jgi:hypothetical protein